MTGWHLVLHNFSPVEHGNRVLPPHQWRRREISSSSNVWKHFKSIDSRGGDWRLPALLVTLHNQGGGLPRFWPDANGIRIAYISEYDPV